MPIWKICCTVYYHLGLSVQFLSFKWYYEIQFFFQEAYTVQYTVLIIGFLETGCLSC